MMKKQSYFSLFFEFIKCVTQTVFHFLRFSVFPQGLLKRSILIILLPLIILQLVIVTFFYERHWDVIAKRLALDVTGEIRVMADMMASGASVQSLQDLQKSLKRNLQLSVSFEDDATLNAQKHFKKPKYLYREIKNLDYPFSVQESSDSAVEVLVELPNGVLKVLVPKKRFYTSTIVVFLVWLIGAAVLVFFIAFLFMKNQVRSIERLSQAAEMFGRGHMNFDFKPSGATEVRQAGNSFLQMRNRIQKYLTERTAMLAAVSHDLRTPLTRMKLQLSMMPQDENTADLLSDVSEMEKMLLGYLSFAKGEGKSEPELFSLNETLDALIQKLKKSGQKIDLHTEQKVEIWGRVNDLTRAFSNILTNAGRYATYAQVNLGIRSGMAVITVDDNGPGIPENKRKDVFRAFYRIEGSRNQETGGVGLGMTIAKDIVLSHGGDIQLETSPMGGLRVIIKLPMK